MLTVFISDPNDVFEIKNIIVFIIVNPPHG